MSLTKDLLNIKNIFLTNDRKLGQIRETKILILADHLTSA